MKKVLIYIFAIMVASAILWVAVFYNKEISEPKMPMPISDAEAVRKIQSFPEVKEYISGLKDAGSEAKFNVEDWGEEWGVQVFEIAGQGEDTHTATFNWFRINKKTGIVSPEF